MATSFNQGDPPNAPAKPTEIVIRVLGKDSKFIGTSMGGMRITLRDVHTGEILATGVTVGGTGDTEQIMQPQGGRRARLADNTAAKFTATLDLEEPRLIEAEAHGPLAQLQGAHRVLSTQWVVPGRSVAGGDGWVLELPGFVVDLLAPPAHVRLPSGTREIELQANVTMMCGCPIEPGGLWDADRYEVKALLKRDGAAIRGVDLGLRRRDQPVRRPPAARRARRVRGARLCLRPSQRQHRPRSHHLHPPRGAARMSSGVARVADPRTMGFFGS